jgi:transglutaminase-like putative cysteine protease
VNYDIHYVTRYRYAGPVVDNINALRVKPATNAHQRPSGFRLTATPSARIYEHVDYFGTTVHEFEVPEPHTDLTIDVSTRCVTTPHPAPPDPVWDAIRSGDYQEAGAEYLVAHEAARRHPVLDKLHADSHADTPLATLRRMCDLIPQTFEYRPGVTYVGSTVADLIDAGAGVCQDFAHVMLALLRDQGIASRYCSGYLFTTDADGAESIEVETHAWIEAMLPDERGEPVWVGFDPTNAILTGVHHVKIGHGRWYSDVPPIKGVFRGPPGAEMSAHVTMRVLPDQPSG